MNHFVYYKDGVELISFYNWVLEHGTEEEKNIHNAETEDGSVTEDFDVLLNKYCRVNGATHVREFNDAGEPVSDMQEVELF